MSQAAVGARFGLLSQLAVQVLSLVTTMVLARLLTQSEMGLSAIVLSIAALTGLMASGGVVIALVNAGERAREVMPQLFSAAVVLGGVLCGALASLAPWLAGVLKADVGNMLIVAAWSNYIVILAAVPLALLQAELNFRAYYVIATTGPLLYFIVEIVLAANGFGAWAVIIGHTVNHTFQVSAALLAAKWLPRLGSLRLLTRPQRSAIVGFNTSTVLMYICRNVDSWIVTRFLGGAAAGVYYIGNVAPNVIRWRMTTVSATILLPMLARAGDDRKAVANSWLTAWSIQQTLGIPILVVMALQADLIVRLLGGAGWALAVPVMTAACAMALVELSFLLFETVANSLNLVTSTISIAAARLVVVCSVVIGILTVRTDAHAVVYVAWGIVPAVAAVYLVQAFIVGRHVPLPLRDIAIRCGWWLLAGGSAAMTVWGARYLTGDMFVLSLLLPACLGVVVYAAVLYLCAPALAGPVADQVAALLRKKSKSIPA